MHTAYMVRCSTQMRYISLFGQDVFKAFVLVLIQKFYIMIKDHVVLAMYCRISKLEMAIIWNKVVSKRIKSVLEK